MGFTILQTDPHERHNLINVPAYRDRAAAMQRTLFDELESRDALRLPVRRPVGERLDESKAASMTTRSESDQADRELVRDQQPIPYAAREVVAMAALGRRAAQRFVSGVGAFAGDYRSPFVLTLHAIELPSCVRCVAVSGSLGRMEYTCHSDVDLIMIAEPASGSNDAVGSGPGGVEGTCPAWAQTAALGWYLFDCDR